MSDRIRFELSVPIATRQDSVGYIACCPPLDIYSQGPTEEVAVRNLTEALELFLASCYRRGQLDRVLKDCGFELDQNPESPAPDTQRMVRILFPWSPVPKLKPTEWRYDARIIVLDRVAMDGEGVHCRLNGH